MTITEAIAHVMRRHDGPMTPKEAYSAIVASGLYEFHAQNPLAVVVSQIRRHSEGIDIPSGSPTKLFKFLGEDKYRVIERPRRTRRKATTVRDGQVRSHGRGESTLSSTLAQLQQLHNRYVSLLKERILSELRKLSPGAFEAFAKRLLEAYGFEDVHVTHISGDGGIDGFGKLKVGLAHLNVAFQCKRWTRGNIQRTEIDKFRGASQGDFEQGVFFATTSFSPGAVGASIKRGAIPIVLLDSQAIVDLMIEKGFGVQSESLAIPTYALDLAVADGNK